MQAQLFVKIMSEKLFVYGTLQEAKIQKEVLGREIEGEVDILYNFTRSGIRIDGRMYPVVFPSFRKFVKGLVLPIEASDLPLLDEYETKVYKRVQVTLKSRTEAWVYLYQR